MTLAKGDVGLGNVDDESKSMMFTNAVLTGTPTAPTAAVATNNTQIASTAFVKAAIVGIGAGLTITVSPTEPGSSDFWYQVI